MRIFKRENVSADSPGFVGRSNRGAARFAVRCLLEAGTHLGLSHLRHL
jgi:hypothetical protein